MEYSDPVNPATFEIAVDLAQHLRSEGSAPLDAAAAEAVSRTFCNCVTGGEDAAEHQFSAIHAQLIQEVIARVQTRDAQADDLPSTS